MAPVRGYEEVDFIARGRESRVYRAKKDGREYAIKQVLGDKASFEHIKNEYEIGCDLNDLDVTVNMHELRRRSGFFGLTTNGYDLIMDYIPGRNFGEIKNDSPEELLPYYFKAVEDIFDIHERGIVHGDIKPENIMLTPEGEVKLIDFGFSFRGITRAEGVKGSLGYLAPEQTGEGNIGPKTDVYNLGASIYESLGGKLPKRIKRKGDGFIKTQLAEVEDIRKFNENIYDEFADVLMGCLEENSEKRARLVDLHIGLYREIERI